jgi:Leucine-rich repeat (LRR) protein
MGPETKTITADLGVRERSGTIPTAGLQSTFCEDVSEIPVTECQALVALYESTDGAHWTENSGWLTTYTPCSWYGVTCNGDHVWALVLYSNHLMGTVPPELGDLGYLQYLYLDSNQLIGDIPPELGSLTSLRGLYLSENQLLGTMPPELGSLAYLQYLYLDSNQLTGDIPPELGSLTNLRGLYLSGNQLLGKIPPEVGSLAALQYLVLHSNQLTGSIPPELDRLTSLLTLRLQNNALSGEVPPEMASLLSLSYLDIGYNALIASDPNAASFLDAKDPDWRGTQTVPPADLHVTAVTSHTVELAWTPIPYIGDGGYYEVSSAPTAGGPYSIHGTSADKLASSYLVDGLSPGEDYHFVVRTHTPAHGSQQNDLWSSYSDVVPATTEPGPAFSVSGQVLAEEGGPISGATVWAYPPSGFSARVSATVSAGSTISATTGATGHYTITGLLAGTYVLTPTLEGWSFTPPTQAVSLPPDAEGVDFFGELICPGFERVELQGPEAGYTIYTYAYTATLIPQGWQPITYTWSPEPLWVRERATAGYRWDEPGSYSITVEAEACGPPLSATLQVRILTHQVTETTEPGVGTTLTFTDTQGNKTAIEVPAGAVSETVTLVYTLIETPTMPSGFVFAGHAFTLEAYQNGELLPGYLFNLPVTITLEYGEADVEGLDEETLELRYWTGDAWSADGITVVEWDTVGNRLVAQMDHLSLFALLVVEEHKMYLPLVLKDFAPNRAPHDPKDPVPADNATDQPLELTLSWTGGDPDGDAVIYDVKLDSGDDTPDTLVCEEVGEPACDPGTLITGTHYYWQVIATDEHSATTVGPVWEFTTTTTICEEGIVNGDFEASSGWEIPITVYRAAYSTAEAHRGSRSMRVGIVNASENVYSYSSARQEVTIPADADSATLGFWLFPLSGEASRRAPTLPERPLAPSVEEAALADDAQYVLILDENDVWIDTVLWQRRNDRAWTYHQADLLDYAGRTIQLQFGVYNDGLGGATGMYVDDVSVEACTTPTPNQPPYVPSAPSPADRATVQPTLLTLTWTGADPDGDAVIYDVKLDPGDDTPDTPACEGVGEPACNPGTLITGTHYYWQVIATDEHSATTIGPVWEFTTTTTICEEGIVNGDFEASSGWEIPITVYRAAYSTAEAHGGSRSMRVGIVNASENVYSYSSARQEVTIPADADSATLGFWLYRLSGEASRRALTIPEQPLASSVEEAVLADDAQYVLILDENDVWIDTVLWQRRDDQAWTYHEADLLDYAGRTIHLQFGVYNDGLGGATGMYVDDVSLTLCSP